MKEIYLFILLGFPLTGRAQSFAFPALSRLSFNDTPIDIAAGDLNGDGYPDIVTTGVQGDAAVLLNRKDGTFTAGTTYQVGGGASR